jgi:hypothetical protein
LHTKSNGDVHIDSKDEGPAPEQFPLKLYKDEWCIICAEPFDAERRIIMTPCRHNYHYECLSPWLNLQRTCPLCRDDVDASVWRNVTDYDITV